jgi:two-component system NtrC family sensor kinase
MAEPAGRLDMSGRRASPGVAPATSAAEWAAEREHLLELLAQQQRVAQAGLVTAGMAHDVNNHLQQISGAAYLALTTDSPEEWRESLRRIQEQCSEAAETTRAFLSFVRRRDAAEIATFRAGEVLDQVRRLVLPLAKKHDVALGPSETCDAVIEGDAQLLVQALVNLASNAVRACADSQGTLTIEASCPADGFCRFEVHDTGPGIPEEIRGRLFRPFSTGHAASGGNGLGLFIVRHAVRRLGGTIRVHTSPAGTTFVLDLPAIPASGPG